MSTTTEGELISSAPWGRGLIGWLLDTSVYFSFDRSGYDRHSRHFEPLAPSLSGLRVLVTGANGGVGFACAKSLYERGAEVIMLCRSEERGQAARACLISCAQSLARDDLITPALIIADLSDLASLERAALKIADNARPLHALIHNAGLLPHERELNACGLEQCVAVHLAGPAYLTHLLSSSLKAGGQELLTREGRGARVVWLSSGGMYTKPLDVSALERLSDPHAPYDGVSAYAYTKRAQVELARMLHQGPEVEHHSAHPGWVDTPGLERSLPGFWRWTRNRLRALSQGADTCVWLCECPQALQGGSFWFDREARSPYLLGHKSSAEERARLWEALKGWATLPSESPLTCHAHV